MSYSLTRTRSRRGIKASIGSDGSLHVTAGIDEGIEDIEAFLYQHRRWIAIHTRANRERQSYREKYLGTDLILLHGIETPVIYKDGDEDYHYDGTALHISTHLDKRTALDRTLKSYADIYLHEMFTRYARDIVKMNVKRVKTYYGICYRKRNEPSYINLNMHLIHADDECIRYVIYHEITHLEVPNHGREFYRRLSMLEPRHGEIRKRLRNIVKIVE